MNAFHAALEPELVTLTVPGAPVAKGRPRISTRGGIARAYTPAKTQRYEDMVRIEAAMAMGERAPVEGAVCLSITAYVVPPKSLSKKRRADAIEGVINPTTRPDADNYAKAVCDACNGILFRDDSQVTDLIVRKRYSERPRLVITMEYGPQ